MYMAKGTVERSIENIFTGLFTRAFKSSVTPLQLGRQLLQVVNTQQETDSQGRRVIPNSYLIELSPHDREGFADLEGSLLQELTASLREYIGQEGFHVEGKARVALHTDADLRKGKFTITSKNVNQDGAATPPAAASAPTLTVVDGGPAFDGPPAVLTLPTGQRIELHEGHYIIGRHLENDIVLNDTNVSRRHAEFVCAAGEVVVRDMGSTNGTKVNGVVVNGEQLLQHGDVINFGSAQVTFEAS